MKRKLLICIITMTLLTVRVNSQQRLFINVYTIGGLEQPIQRILYLYEITTGELEEQIQTVERLLIESEKGGKTPLYQGSDNMVFDLLEALNYFPADTYTCSIIYSDFQPTDNSLHLFRDPNARRNTNNSRNLERYIINRLHTFKRVYPVIVRGSRGTSNPALARNIATPNQRVYELNSTAEMRNDIYQGFESSTIILSIMVDLSNSLQDIVIPVINDIKELMTVAVNRSLSNSLNLTMDDFIYVENALSHVGTNPRQRPDEIYFQFHLSSHYVMRTPVPQWLYNQYLKAASGAENPAKLLGDELNQTNITYFEALRFIEWLNSRWNHPGTTLVLITEFQLEHAIRLNPSGFSFGSPRVREMTSTFYSDYDANQTIDPKGASSYGTHLSTRMPSYEDTNPQLTRPEFRGRIAANTASPLTGLRLALIIE